MAKEIYKINEVFARNRKSAITIINGRSVDLLATKDRKQEIPSSKDEPKREYTIHAPSQADLKFYYDESKKTGSLQLVVIANDNTAVQSNP